MTILSASREAIRAAKLRPEKDAVANLLRLHDLNTGERAAILEKARALLRDMRADTGGGDLVQTLLREMDLGSAEGVALMSLAEALLRVPDSATAEALIDEKLHQGDWHRFRETAQSPMVKAVGFLMDIAASITEPDTLVATATRGLSLPAIRAAAQQVISLMARRFVFAPTIEEAVAVAQRAGGATRFSFDMLGEGARTKAQAAAFRDAYARAIDLVGQSRSEGPRMDEPGISVKLSALHPRFEVAQGDRLRTELFPIIEELARMAKARDVGFTVDAEEANRLEPTLDVFEFLARSPRLRDWDGLGLAVQAYGKRAPAVLAWLDTLGEETRRRFRVRLVKGAYWDAEIKHAQAEGLPDYPVYTRKAATDLSYLACARRMIESERILPQFATHNVHTVAAIRHMAGDRPFEFQRLHGMGERLYEILREQGMTTPVRVYAPVGHFHELLPYLIRRMLENGANSSFVRAAFDPRREIEAVVEDPIATIETDTPSKVPQPRDIFPSRRNSAGLDLADMKNLERLSETAKSLHLDRAPPPGERIVTSPADRRKIIGTVREARKEDVLSAIADATAVFESWRTTDVEQRAQALERAADIFEQGRDRFVSLIVAEAGRTLRDAVSEVRETVDFCRFYANEARRLFLETRLPGITGERNVLRLTGRGVFACISPWNFPLAIFTGQVAAALAAGNTVIAKPAEQTPLTAAAAIAVLHEAGIPASVLHLVQGDAEIGKALTSDPRIAGVVFTGSTAAAKAINRALAARDAAIAPLIAETGGVNAMFVDASALPEQVVDDVITSGFLSAGQRCSSLRHLFVQEDCADTIIEMIAGAMDLLRIGDPADAATDVGPLIDEDACSTVAAHIEAMRARGARIVRQLNLPPSAEHGSFLAPALIELPDPAMLDKEVFGPVVHVTRWRRSELDAMLAHVQASGFGLTLGIHSRVTGFADEIVRRARCGNAYINRNMIGAVVGAQPFGGRGLSGTGPKAGGPNYLARFATEEVATTNLTAIGGDLELLNA